MSPFPHDATHSLTHECPKAPDMATLSKESLDKCQYYVFYQLHLDI